MKNTQDALETLLDLVERVGRLRRMPICKRLKQETYGDIGQDMDELSSADPVVCLTIELASTPWSRLRIVLGTLDLPSASQS